MNLGNVLVAAADRSPDKLALICGGDQLSFAELDRISSAVGASLLEEGLQPGNRVAIHRPNSIESVVLYFACFKAGLIAVPVNTRLKAPEVGYVLQHSEASICFSHAALADITREAIRSTGLSIPLRSDLPLCDSSPTRELPEVNGSAPCIILYTSGTTARPKGVTHSHSSLLGGARLMLSVIGDAGSVTLVMTQMAHISGIGCALLPSILRGMTSVLLPVFDPAQALDLIERFGVTFTGALPAMAAMMTEEQARRPRNVNSLRTFISAGDSVPLSLQERFRSLFGVPVIEFIGMTESVPTCWNTADDLRPGSLGKPRLGVEVRIIGESEGEAGEMAVRSPGNFLEYWRDPVSTSEALRDGWLHTGDLVRRDAEGYLWFAGRLKQIIIRGGSNIAPQEVEEALLQHPAVLEAGVTGIPDAILGQRVGAFLTLREGQPASEAEVREFVRERLADYKVPEKIWVLPRLPKGLTGKVDRRTLSEMASSEADKLFQPMKAGV